MTRIRMDPATRQRELFAAAYSIAETQGLKAVTRVNVARDTETTPGLINRYFDSRNGLRDAVVAHAIKQKHIGILAQAVTMDSVDTSVIPARLLKAAHELNAS